MIDHTFPKTEPEFRARFSTEEACRDYLVKIRWPKGFACSRCKGRKYYRVENRDLWVCADCKYQCSIRAGTIFDNSAKPLVLWFMAMFHVCFSKRSISALELQRRLGLGSYRTAWHWLHKIRECMTPSDTMLSEIVEVDEKFMGGRRGGESNTSPGKLSRGRRANDKAIIAGAVEHMGRHSGRLRLQVVESDRAEDLEPFVEDFIAEGTIVRADRWTGYSKLHRFAFILNASTCGDALEIRNHLPYIHRVFGLLEHWMLGTFHGSYSKKHLQAYLDEFVFRFERRNVKVPGFIFQNLIRRVVRQKCRKYADLVGSGREERKAARAASWWRELRATLVHIREAATSG